MNKRVEKGKAVIQLAQIIIILSGFLFATGGVAYTNSINVLSTSLPLLTSQSLELIKTDELNLTTEKKELISEVFEVNKKYLDTVEPQLNFAKWSFWFGGIGALISFIIWNIGYWMIKTSKEEDKNA